MSIEHSRLSTGQLPGVMTQELTIKYFHYNFYLLGC